MGILDVPTSQTGGSALSAGPSRWQGGARVCAGFRAREPARDHVGRWRRGRNPGSAARGPPGPLQLGRRRKWVLQPLQTSGPFLQGADSRAAETGRASQEKGQSQSPLYARIMQTPLTTTVPVLRLPRGPDGLSRGFAPDGRRAPLKPVVPEIPESQESRESQEQRARATLRERYLRSLLAMVGRQVSFTLHEGVHVTAHFGATDLDVANFYVSQLQTPIGVQAEALLRCSDIVSYTFKP
ncbi:gem-associated protein 7 isoform X1 [Phocoena sinus]|uniref:gem-associated protein 7 isoform X1 n=2 Tax=Phocoena TaxID=9741 RepID=UPI0013C45714|nr:gem-associated protein 7 isoform X1 [Phocoena sinus]